jgi:hypothetical protein
MGVRGAAWFVALPLVAVGWLSAHALAYVLVAPDAHERAHLLAETGHGYLGAAPAVVAFALTVLACGFVLVIVERLRGAAHRPVPPLWPVALVAPLGFAIQEHVERLIELHAVPTGAALEPSFIAGLALQLPFAGAAMVIARAVIVVGAAVGDALAAAAGPGVTRFAASLRPLRWNAPALPALPVLATGHAQRAPPNRRCA